jgi:C1A family cysteine protease
MCILLLAASTTTVVARGDEDMITVSTNSAISTTPNSSPALDGQALLRDLSEKALEEEREQARIYKDQSETANSHPVSVDWRRKDGQDWTTPVRNASTCGACVAFAVIGSMESRLKIAAGDSSLNPDLSEAHLFFGSCDQCCDGGMSVEPALQYSLHTGITDEACYPYSPRNQPFSPCTGWQTRTTAIATWSGTFNTAAMKQALAKDGPIVATLNLYEDFRSYSGGIYQHTHGEFLSRHAVTLVGYDEAGGYWIGKNSWGTDWGEDRNGNPNGGGWFRIYFGQAGIDDFAYVPQVSVGSAGHGSTDPALETEKGLHGSPR